MTSLDHPLDKPSSGGQLQHRFRIQTAKDEGLAMGHAQHKNHEPSCRERNIVDA